MRVVIQRVSRATVTVEEKITGEIASGLLVLLGIEDADTDQDVRWLSNKIVNLRIFNDGDGVMNCSLMETFGDILLGKASLQFPRFRKDLFKPSRARKPDFAIPMYEKIIMSLRRISSRKF